MDIFDLVNLFAKTIFKCLKEINFLYIFTKSTVLNLTKVSSKIRFRDGKASNVFWVSGFRFNCKNNISCLLKKYSWIRVGPIGTVSLKQKHKKVFLAHNNRDRVLQKLVLGTVSWQIKKKFVYFQNSLQENQST